MSNLQLLHRLEYIREHLADNLGLEVLARETGLNALS